MILFIDTSEFKSLRFGLISNTDTKEITAELAFNENYKTNDLLAKFMKKQKTDFAMLEKIVVCSGPGSFNGIRVGVSLAQAIGFAIHIPVITIRKNKIPKDLQKLLKLQLNKSQALNYGQLPNITLAKKK